MQGSTGVSPGFDVIPTANTCGHVGKFCGSISEKLDSQTLITCTFTIFCDFFDYDNHNHDQNERCSLSQAIVTCSRTDHDVKHALC